MLKILKIKLHWKKSCASPDQKFKAVDPEPTLDPFLVNFCRMRTRIMSYLPPPDSQVAGGSVELLHHPMVGLSTVGRNQVPVVSQPLRIR
jgi:hypothetical protein